MQLRQQRAARRRATLAALNNIAPATYFRSLAKHSYLFARMKSNKSQCNGVSIYSRCYRCCQGKIPGPFAVSSSLPVSSGWGQKQNASGDGRERSGVKHVKDSKPCIGDYSIQSVCLNSLWLLEVKLRHRMGWRYRALQSDGLVSMCLVWSIRNPAALLYKAFACH